MRKQLSRDAHGAIVGRIGLHEVVGGRRLRSAVRPEHGLAFGRILLRAVVAEKLRLIDVGQFRRQRRQLEPKDFRLTKTSVVVQHLPDRGSPGLARTIARTYHAGRDAGTGRAIAGKRRSRAAGGSAESNLMVARFRSAGFFAALRMTNRVCLHPCPSERSVVGFRRGCPAKAMRENGREEAREAQKEDAVAVGLLCAFCEAIHELRPTCLSE